MNFRITATPNFDKDVKALNKRYKSFKSDLLNFRNILLQNPRAGTPIGNSCFKIRLAIQSKGKGKSGGARIITHVISVDENKGTIYLLAVYDKSEQITISDKEIDQILKQIK